MAIPSFHLSAVLFIASHKATEKGPSTRGVKATLLLAISLFFFTHPKMLFLHPLYLPSSTSSSFSSFNIFALNLSTSGSFQELHWIDNVLFVRPCFLRSEMEPASYTTIQTNLPHLTERNNSCHAGVIVSYRTGRLFLRQYILWQQYDCMTWFMTGCTNDQFHVCYFYVTCGQFMKSFALSAPGLNDSSNWVFLLNFLFKLLPQLKRILCVFNIKSCGVKGGSETFVAWQWVQLPVINMYSGGIPVNIHWNFSDPPCNIIHFSAAHPSACHSHIFTKIWQNLIKRISSVCHSYCELSVSEHSWELRAWNIYY